MTQFINLFKMKPIDVTGDSYAEYDENCDKKDPKFKVGDNVRISKYIYFDVLDDIVNKYKNTVHGKIKMKPLGLHLILMLNTMKILTKKTLNVKLVIVSECQNTKTLLLKNTPKIGQKKFLSLAKLKLQFHGLMLLVT